MIPEKPEPGYLQLHASGELENRACRAYHLLKACSVCPRRCGVNRLEDERGFCRTGLLPMISSYGPHFGEEPPLVGRGGSGTIFITRCNLACSFCQNYKHTACLSAILSCRRTCREATLSSRGPQKRSPVNLPSTSRTSNP